MKKIDTYLVRGAYRNLGSPGERIQTYQHSSELLEPILRPTRRAAPTVERLRQHYGEHGDELQMPMDFLFTNVNKLSAPEFRKQIAAADSSGGWPVCLFSNHDDPRQQQGPRG